MRSKSSIWVAAGVLLLFLCVSGASAACDHPAVCNTDTGISYATIQEAVNDAMEGARIEVDSGVYDGFTVDRELTIKGVSYSKQPLPRISLSGTEDTISVNADRVILESFEVVNSAVDPTGTGVYLTSSETILRKIAFHNLSTGISMDGDNNIVDRCTFKWLKKGINIQGYSNEVRYSDFTELFVNGIVVGNTAEDSSNYIVGNTFSSIYTNPFYSTPQAISIWGPQNTIRTNTFTNNYLAIVTYPPPAGWADYNDIYDNMFWNSGVNNIGDISRTNYWDQLSEGGPSIIGGPYIGGNYWGADDPQDWSLKCLDDDSDGFCDAPLLDTGMNITDNYPLTGDYTLPSPPPAVDSITPDTSPNPRSVSVTIQGTNLDSAVSVEMYPACDCSSILASDVVIVSPLEITCTFDLNVELGPGESMDAGIVVYDSDYRGIPLDRGFTITGSTPLSCVSLDTAPVILTLVEGALDLDTGVIGASGDNDVLWIRDGVDPVTRMETQNGATIYNVGVWDLGDFEDISITDLMGYAYGSGPLSSTEVVTNDIFAVHTSLGNYAKVFVEDRDLVTDQLTLRVVTYSVGTCQESGYEAILTEYYGGSLPDGYAVYVADTLLDPFTRVDQWGRDMDRHHTTGEEKTLYYIFDPNPDANQEHYQKWYFVDTLGEISEYEVFTPAVDIPVRWMRGVVPRISALETVEPLSFGDVVEDLNNGQPGFGTLGVPAGCEQVDCTSCKALLISGGFEPSRNYARYYTDISTMWQTLTAAPYCYPEENIVVLMSDGIDKAADKCTQTSPTLVLEDSNPDFDNDGEPEVDGMGDLANVTKYLGPDWAGSLGPEDTLYVFTTNHGGNDTYPNSGEARLWLWKGEFIWDNDFTELVALSPARTVMVTMEQCYSGGFIDDIVGYAGDQTRMIATAANANEPSIANDFSSKWIFGLGGAANNVPSGDGAGIITFNETHKYAYNTDASRMIGKEHPQYGDSTNAGLTMGLSSCSMCPRPGPLPGMQPPTDYNGDGVYEDLDGNNAFDYMDAVAYFNNWDYIKDPANNEPLCAFDFNGNGKLDFQDIVTLYSRAS